MVTGVRENIRFGSAEAVIVPTGVLVHPLLLLFSNGAPRQRIETLLTFNRLV